MANIVEQINDAIEARILATVPTFKILEYILDIESNNFRTNKKRFGSRPLASAPGIDTLKNYSQLQVFEIILTNDYTNKNKSDENQRAQTFELYDKMDDIFVDIINTKAGIPSIIVNIETPSIEEPEYLDTVAILRASVPIQYRQSLI